MKKGKSLHELCIELERQAEKKEDYIADTRHLRLSEQGDTLIIGKGDTGYYFHNGDRFGTTPTSHRQIGDRVGIPAKYYDRMREESPELLAHNVNHWFDHKPERRMIRTMDGNARAFLSDRYRRLDNYELMEAVLPTFKEIPELRVESCEVTESRLYLKAVTERITAELKVGDAVQAGIVISNSEVGLGSFRVEPMVFVLSCLNGMIAPAYGMKKYHVGKKVESEEAAYQLYSDETLQADDRAFWLKARDIVKGAFSQDIFNKLVEEMREAAEKRITGNPVKAVEVLADKFRLSQNESGGIMKHLIQNGDMSLMGLSNAVTRSSQDIESYDRATELEKMGHEVITVGKRDWKEIAEAV